MIAVIVVYVVGVKTGQSYQNKPVSSFYNLGDVRVHKDSMYNVQSVYDEYQKKTVKIIMFAYNGDIIYKECLGEEPYESVQEEVDTYLYPLIEYDRRIE